MSSKKRRRSSRDSDSDPDFEPDSDPQDSDSDLEPESDEENPEDLDYSGESGSDYNSPKRKKSSKKSKSPKTRKSRSKKKAAIKVEAEEKSPEPERKREGVVITGVILPGTQTQTPSTQAPVKNQVHAQSSLLQQQQAFLQSLPPSQAQQLSSLQPSPLIPPQLPAAQTQLLPLPVSSPSAQARRSSGIRNVSFSSQVKKEPVSPKEMAKAPSLREEKGEKSPESAVKTEPKVKEEPEPPNALMGPSGRRIPKNLNANMVSGLARCDEVTQKDLADTLAFWGVEVVKGLNKEELFEIYIQMALKPKVSFKKELVKEEN